MGSSASKNKRNKKISGVVTATFAFDDAGKRATEKRQQNEGGDAKDGELVEEKVSESSPLLNGEVKRPSQAEQGGVMMDDGDDNDELMLSNASTKIQSAFRGFQERRLRKKETEMAIKIQRIYRRHSSTKKAPAEGEQGPASPKAEPSVSFADPLESHAEEPTDTEEVFLGAAESEKKPENSNQCDETKKPHGKVLTKKDLVGVGQKTKEDFIAFQDEITELKWYAEQQLEKALCGSEFVGPRIVLVSSKVPKGELLSKIVRKDVLIFIYDFNKDTYDVLIDNIKVNLQSYKEGCKARSICIYCQGGPGFLYIRRSKVATVAKLKKECEQDQVRFFKELGKLITKIEPQKSVIHVMGCNVMGNQKGQELFDHLEQLIKPNHARFEAPLELSPAGVNMIECYFDFEKYKVWRSHKHSKTDVDL